MSLKTSMYPLNIVKKGGEFFGRFRNFHSFEATGKNVAMCLTDSSNLLKIEVERRVEEGETIPKPSSGREGDFWVGVRYES